MRFGTNAAASATAKAGTGTLRINNGAIIRAQAATNFAAGQQIVSSSVPLQLSRINLVTNVAPNASGSFDFIGTHSTGMLGLEANFSGALNLANIGAGRMWLAADFGPVSYTADSLSPGAPTPYDSAATTAIYRLGGGTQILSWRRRPPPATC